MDSNWLHTLITVFITAVVALLPFVWTNFRRKSRVIEVLDLAKKKTDFWAQYLQVGTAATLPNTDEQNQLRVKVLFRINEIVADTENELTRLSWSKRIRAQMTQKRLIRDQFPPNTRVRDKVAFWLMVAVGYLFDIVYLFFVFVLWKVALSPREPNKSLEIVGVIAMIFAFGVYASYTRFSAYLIKYPAPKERVGPPMDSGPSPTLGVGA